MNATIEIRQQNLDETDSMAQYESPEGDDVCASYVSRDVSEQLGEFATLAISDDASIEAELQKETTNYAVYETAAGLVTGLYISHEVFGEDVPEAIGLAFAPSDEETFNEALSERQEEAEEEAQEEADALISIGDEDSDESSQEDEATEITDEELDLDAEA